MNDMDADAIERATRYAQCDPELIEWAAEQGHENLKERFDSMRTMTSHASATLTVLLAGMGASLAYAVKVLEPDASSVAIGAAVLCVYLSILSATLVCKCMLMQSAPTMNNEPDKLLAPGYLKISVQLGELARLQQRIAEVASFNARKARWLNRVRIAAILSPAVFAAAALLSPYLRRIVF